MKKNLFLLSCGLSFVANFAVGCSETKNTPSDGSVIDANVVRDSALDSRTDTGAVDAGADAGAPRSQFSTTPVSTMTNAGSTDFASALALSGNGNVLAVGNSADNEVLIYTKNGNDWINVQTLAKPEGSMIGFGVSLALSNDGAVLVIGDTTSGAGNNGRAHVYTRSGNVWSSIQTLDNPASNNRHFGAAVATFGDGSTIAIADYGAGDAIYNGKVFFYTKSGVTYSAAGFLDKAENTRTFGTALAYNSAGTRLFVGDSAFGEGSHGAIHVYDKSGNEWTQVTTIVGGEDDFGVGSAIAASADGREIISGDRDYGTGTDGVGALKAFYGESTSFRLVQTLVGPAGTLDFGYSVALTADGRTAYVGDWEAGSSADGALYTYTRPAN